MIINQPETRFTFRDNAKIRQCMIFDSYPLMVLIVGKYISLNPKKKFILKKCDKKLLKCIENIITNYTIKTIYITPHMFSEFVNHIRNHYKNYYKQIKKTLIEDLKQLEEIQIEKNKMIEHKNFVEYGNDISIVLASEQKLKEYDGLAIVTKDSRFIEKFYNETNNVYCFNLKILQEFY